MIAGLPLSFAEPVLLLGLLSLPLLWWLLRVMPPRPRRVEFPPTRLLFDIAPKEETPSRTPWWLTALRLLAAALVDVLNRKHDTRVADVHQDVIEQFRRYSWPGNVRELENTIERAVALESGPEISLAVLPDRIAGFATASLSGGIGGGPAAFPPDGIDFEKEIAQAERRYLLAALEKSEGVRTRAAELLKITYRSFRHYAKKHNVS